MKNEKFDDTERKRALETFSKTLKELRLQYKLSQEAIAENIGVSREVISFWENSKREPSLTNALALAEFFDISLDDLIGRK